MYTHALCKVPMTAGEVQAAGGRRREGSESERVQWPPSAPARRPAPESTHHYCEGMLWPATSSQCYVAGSKEAFECCVAGILFYFL